MKRRESLSDAYLRDLHIIRKNMKENEERKDTGPAWWRLERWFDRHNHKMEFIRTLFGAMTVILQIVIICKIFKN